LGRVLINRDWFGNRWLSQKTYVLCRKLRRSSAAVATSREGQPRSGRAVQHRRWDRARRRDCSGSDWPHAINQRIGFYTALNPDCTAQQGNFTVRVTRCRYGGRAGLRVDRVPARPRRGSSATPNTIGMVVVAALAASAATVVPGV